MCRQICATAVSFSIFFVCLFACSRLAPCEGAWQRWLGTYLSHEEKTISCRSMRSKTYMTFAPRMHSPPYPCSPTRSDDRHRGYARARVGEPHEHPRLGETSWQPPICPKLRRHAAGAGAWGMEINRWMKRRNVRLPRAHYGRGRTAACDPLDRK